jgi:hypothetical protein
MKNLHFNNSSKSKQSTSVFALQVLTEILENRDNAFTLSIDDGDGDVWKHTIEVRSERIKSITTPITEN